MSIARNVASVIADMAAALEYLNQKEQLTEQEQDVLLVCNESFQALENVASVFLKYSKDLKLPRGDNYGHVEALAFGAALQHSGVFGHTEHNHQSVHISSELEQTQVDEFQALMGSIDSE